MKVTCPKNPAHNRFVTVAHVAEDWVVNEHGDFIETVPNSQVEVLKYPSSENTWTCTECGATAIVEN